MPDYLNPPIPPGGITDGTINYNVLNNPVDTGGLPPLPSLSTLPSIGGDSTLSGVTGQMSNAVSNAVSPSAKSSGSTATSDGFVAKIAYLLLGVVIIAGAIWTYRK
jgi:hypothetical protein